MRKTKTIVLQEDGRELQFMIKQMSASQLEAWLIRAILLLSKSGAEVPEGTDLQAAGAYLAKRGLSALGDVNYEQVKPLLDDLLACCHHVTGANSTTQLSPTVVDSIIGDVKTLFTLRKEALMLNLGFLGPEVERLSGSHVSGNTEAQ